MCCRNFWTRIIPFSLALIFGLLTVNILQKENMAGKNEKDIKLLNKVVYTSGGAGCGECKADEFGKFDVDNPSDFRSETKPLQITSKPKANYTNSARQNQVQGIVTLRVTFNASGQIGSVSPVDELPYGLTEQAIAAAREIKFEPLKRNGAPQTTIKLVQYNFTIY
jgi:TonB family protein